jgi:glycine/D-amino acid oxidase-like deaminating enzyme
MTKTILIIGAGIVGSALAYRLGQSGCLVTILDPSADGGTASGASFGWVNASYENPKPYYNLRRYAMDAWTRLLPDLPDLPYTQNGTLYADFYGIPLETLHREHTPWGYPFEWITPDQIAALESNLTATPKRALFCGIEAQVLPDVAARAFLANAPNTTHIKSCATSLITKDGAIAGAETPDGPIYADTTILAAGTQTTTLAVTANINVPLDSPAGLLIHTKPAPPLISHTILTDGLHMQQRPDGTLTAGGDFGGGSINDYPETGSRELFSRLQNALNTNALEFSHYTLGLRPTPKDGMPIVGSPKRGLYITVMHSGATLAPGIAELATAEITAGHRDALLNTFHPDRFHAD